MATEGEVCCLGPLEQIAESTTAADDQDASAASAAESDVMTSSATSSWTPCQRVLNLLVPTAILLISLAK